MSSADADTDRARLRRTQILDAAAECFRRNGFHAASIAEISKAAGMSAGHIYNYFENKDAIVAAIVERGLDEFQEVFERFASADNLRDTMLAEVDHALECCLDLNECRLQLELCAEAGRNEHIATLVRRADAHMFDRFVGLMRSVLGPDMPQAEVDARVEAMFALFDGLSVRAVRHPEVDRQALAGSMRRMLAALFEPD
ncbi:TetR/AcrR family transcriptional regulator [Derxia gummosa]|uniref:TetR/AcrR family transcriptional regulator n=1 Tax=Derxia gummosa DSM 723 TaxID=1121388 RepID=A0A8B6X2U8_9BURK|nr:TetR/AcrR family transcriptional regulator [Derxia gummosa]